MSEAKHTPGEWVVTEGGDGTYVRANGYALCRLYLPDLDSPTADDEIAANARLMAAAPEMLGVIYAEHVFRTEGYTQRTVIKSFGEDSDWWGAFVSGGTRGLSRLLNEKTAAIFAKVKGDAS